MTVVPRDLAWTAAAPFHAQASARSTASPEAVFAVLADHAAWPEWFRGLQRVTVLGPADGVGARRRVHLRGASVDEEFIAWAPGARFSFTAVAARPALVRSLVEDCRLVATPDGTEITYAMYIDAVGLVAPLRPLVAVALRANLGRALGALARRAEQR